MPSVGRPRVLSVGGGVSVKASEMEDHLARLPPSLQCSPGLRPVASFLVNPVFAAVPVRRRNDAGRRGACRTPGCAGCGRRLLLQSGAHHGAAGGPAGKLKLS